MLYSLFPLRHIRPPKARVPSVKIYTSSTVYVGFVGHVIVDRHDLSARLKFLLRRRALANDASVETIPRAGTFDASALSLDPARGTESRENQPK